MSLSFTPWLCETKFLAWYQTSYPGKLFHFPQNPHGESTDWVSLKPWHVMCVFIGWLITSARTIPFFHSGCVVSALRDRSVFAVTVHFLFRVALRHYWDMAQVMALQLEMPSVPVEPEYHRTDVHFLTVFVHMCSLFCLVYIDGILLEAAEIQEVRWAQSTADHSESTLILSFRWALPDFLRSYVLRVLAAVHRRHSTRSCKHCGCRMGTSSWNIVWWLHA